MKMEEESAESIEGYKDYEKVKKILSAFFSLLLFSIGFTLGFTSGPLGTGIVIIISIIIYVLLFTMGVEVRLPFLMLALGAHIGFLYKYWKDIELLPLFYITKDKLGGSLSFDYIQLLVYIEIALGLRRFIRKRRGLGEKYKAKEGNNT